MKFDVIVVGSGPAGTESALTVVKESKKSVLLLERLNRPKSICAGGVSIGEIIDFGISVPKDCIQSKVKCAVIKFGREELRVYADEFNLKYLGYVIDRERFDLKRLEEAKRLGVRIELNCLLKRIYKSGGEWRVIYEVNGVEVSASCRVLVCADGVESRIAGMVGVNTSVKPRDLLMTYQVYLTSNSSSECLFLNFDRKYSKAGYVWEFPAGKYVKVGVGCLLHKRVDVKSILRDYLIDRSLIEGRVIKEMFKALPLSKPLNRVSYFNSMALVGDAARLTDPLTGAGIINAIVSGRIVGELISSGKPLRFYDKEIEWMKKENRVKYALRDFLLKLSNEEVDELIKSIKRSGFKSFKFLREASEAVKRYLVKKPKLALKCLFNLAKSLK